MLDALRRRGLWDGKAREMSQAGTPRALVAEREKLLKPSDPMNPGEDRPWFAAAADVVDPSSAAASSSPTTSAGACSACVVHWPTQTKWPAMWRVCCLASGVETTVHQSLFATTAPAGAWATNRVFSPPADARSAGACGSASRIPITNLSSAKGSISTLSAMRIFGTAGCAALSAYGVRTLSYRLKPAGCAFPPITMSTARAAAAREASRRSLAEGRAVAVSMARRGRRRLQRRPLSKG